MRPNASEVLDFKCEAAKTAVADKARRTQLPIGGRNPITKPEDDGNDKTTGELLARELQEYRAPIETRRAEVLDIMANLQTEVKPR
jgi:hypothetical protein